MALILLSSAQADGCGGVAEWIDKACNRISDTAKNGSDELLLSGYAHHDRGAYSPEEVDKLNENAWGLGYAREKDDEKGNSHRVYGLAFEHSNRGAQLNAGYMWQGYIGDRSGLQAGAGYTAFVFQRNDIANGIPLPAVAPVVSLRYKKATVYSVIIPPIPGESSGTIIYTAGGIGF